VVVSPSLWRGLTRDSLDNAIPHDGNRASLLRANLEY